MVILVRRRLNSALITTPVVLVPGDNNLGVVGDLGDVSDHPNVAHKPLDNSDEEDNSNCLVTGNRSKSISTLEHLDLKDIIEDESVIK